MTVTDYHFPQMTLFAASLSGIIFVVLTVLVITARGASKISLGDGNGQSRDLLVATRSHANFAEFVPLTLLLLAGLEMLEGPTLTIKMLVYGLVIGRVCHPIGMRMETAPNFFRAAGFCLTLFALAGSALALIVKLAPRVAGAL